MRSWNDSITAAVVALIVSGGCTYVFHVIKQMRDDIRKLIRIEKSRNYHKAGTFYNEDEE